MRIILATLVTAFLAACGSMPDAADPASDAPEARIAVSSQFKDAPSYREALKLWQNAEDVNAWIGARFRYDMSRAMELSETQRQKFIAEYALYRGRQIVSFREMESFERKPRTLAFKQDRAGRP